VFEATSASESEGNLLKWAKLMPPEHHHPPLGFLPCTRPAPHDGPCAHPPFDAAVPKPIVDATVATVPSWQTLVERVTAKADKKIDQAAKKADLGLIPLKALYGAARVFTYGSKKYAEGNFYEAMLADGAGRRYISALLRHCSEMQLSNGLHTPSSLVELDEESGLPHIDHAICGLLMLRSILAKDGALPVDPGAT
jgi:hypothetical protein